MEIKNYLILLNQLKTIFSSLSITTILILNKYSLKCLPIKSLDCSSLYMKCFPVYKKYILFDSSNSIWFIFSKKDFLKSFKFLFFSIVNSTFSCFCVSKIKILYFSSGFFIIKEGSFIFPCPVFKLFKTSITCSFPSVFFSSFNQNNNTYNSSNNC